MSQTISSTLSKLSFQSKSIYGLDVVRAEHAENAGNEIRSKAAAQIAIFLNRESDKQHKSSLPVKSSETIISQDVDEIDCFYVRAVLISNTNVEPGFFL